MSLQPLQDRILAEVVSADKKVGSIILPETARQNPVTGKVISVGPGKISESGSRLPMDVTAGDTIIFENNVGTEVKEDDHTYVIMKQSDILAKINN